jgi:uncharacterized repeat protein (TIGR01451 family)
MWLASLRRLMTAKVRLAQPPLSRSQRRRIRLAVEFLEDRIVPSTLTVDAGDVNGTPPTGDYSLVGAINKANADGSGDIIQLTAGTYNVTSTFTSVNSNSTHGAVAVPVITATNLTIFGNGSTINGNSSGRLFDVASGAGVTMENLTLKGGEASGSNAQGGAVYNSGNLTLKTVIVEGNKAVGGAGQSGQGGGIYSNGGTLDVTNCTISANNATGGAGGPGAAGGNAQGGGIYASGATLTVSGGKVSGGTLRGGNGGAGTANLPTGGAGGNAEGGGIYALNSTVILTNGVSVSTNSIIDTGGGNIGKGGAGYNGGAGGAGGNAEGGGVYFAAQSSSNTLTIETGALINNNTASGGFGGQGGLGDSAKSGGAGGAGGFAQGGGVYDDGGSVSITGTNTQINDNTAGGGQGGTGGNGGAGAGGLGGAGGAGGEADGGGLYVLNAPLTVTGQTSLSPIPAPGGGNQSGMGISYNTANGGSGGRGGFGGLGNGSIPGAATGETGGAGGAGGAAQGGGIFVSGSSLAVALGDATHVANVNFNTATGGAGGSGSLGGPGTSAHPEAVGGAGGQASGGGLAVIGDTLSLKNTTLWSNNLHGGAGGTGARSLSGKTLGNFGGGGSVTGGGLYVSGSSNALVLNSTIAENLASAGTGHVGGNAQGGGLAAVASSTVQVINSTFAVNVLNAATGGNSATPSGGLNNQGGGLYSANGTLSLVNATVAWNDIVAYTNRGSSAAQGPGVYNGPSDTLNLENTILALNQFYGTFPGSGISPTPTFADLAGVTAPTQNDDNLIGDGIDSSLNYLGSEQLFVPALTTNLPAGAVPTQWQLPGNYGGLTYVLPLAWTSPALAKGDIGAAGTIANAEGLSNANEATDQRGLPRVIDSTIDIGAVEMQLILDGSASATSISAGGTITYNLTVTNNEAIAVNVTLTDAIPANTAYQANSASVTGFAQPTLSNNTLSATTTTALASGQSATLTFSVTVNSGTSAGTEIVNTATILPTGNTAAGGRSVTFTTQVSGVTTTDITPEVEIHHSAVNPDPQNGAGAYKQRLLLENDSGATLTGPIALVLTGLPSGVSLINATGLVPSGTYAGDPYIDIVLSGDSWLAGWRNFLMLVLEFSDPNGYAITYSPVILQGI